MAVNREWRCVGHNLEFEGTHPICPHGCQGEGMIVQEFRTVPGYMGYKTKFTDKGMRAIAADHGLTDMSNRHGRSVMENRRYGMKKPAPEQESKWITDQIKHAQPGFSQRKEEAPKVDFRQLGIASAPGESFTQRHFSKPSAFTHIEHKPYRPRAIQKVSKA